LYCPALTTGPPHVLHCRIVRDSDSGAFFLTCWMGQRRHRQQMWASFDRETSLAFRLPQPVRGVRLTIATGLRKLRRPAYKRLATHAREPLAPRFFELDVALRRAKFKKPWHPLAEDAMMASMPSSLRCVCLDSARTCLTSIGALATCLTLVYRLRGKYTAS
jgi:hypothetical protein